jgi:DegV family protein with EDD domain
VAVTIVTDSGADLGLSEASRLGIDVVPVWILVGSERLRDGIDIDRSTLLARLSAGDPVKSEPPDEDQFKQIFTRHIAAGNDVVAVTLSSQLSQSFARASAAAAEFPGRVHVVDSRAAAGLESLLAIYAAELARAGTPAAEIARKVQPASVKSAAYFAVPDLNALGKSGRLPKAVVALGSMLNVSLVLKLNEEGAIGPGGQSFSFEKTCDIMLDAVVRAIDHSPKVRISFAHVGARDVVAKLSKQLTEKLGHPPAMELVHEPTATLIANIGPGAIGVFALVP